MDDENETAGPRSADPRRRSGARGAIIAALIALAVVAAASVVLAPRASTCRFCHGARGRSAATSTHRQLPCASCHSRQGLSGWLESRAREAAYMYPRALLRSADATSATRIDSATCTACHQAVFRRVVTVNGVRMRHATCIATGVRCTECHGTVGHGAGAARQAFPTMDACDPCHDGTDAPSACATCHTGDREASFGGTSPWRVTHGPNWRTTHGMGSLDSCRLCHPASKCTQCHYAQPHPETWAEDHGRAAATTGDIRKACLNCHVRAFCDSCHGMAMPHPSDWLPAHMKATKGKTDPACRRCHTEADCSTCHTMHTHPGRIDLGRRK